MGPGSSDTRYPDHDPARPPEARLSYLAIIPARGGSKGVFRKNIKTLAGKPLIAWTIEAARGSSFLSRVVVSTDDPEIAAVSRQFGAEVPFLRPPELAGDAAPVTEVILHLLHALDGLAGTPPDFLVLLQPTSPLRLSSDIDQAIAFLEKEKGQAVASITSMAVHPFWARKLKPDKTIEPFFKEMESRRRQELPEVYTLNGAIYITGYKYFLAHKTFSPPATLGFIMPPERSIDIDTEWDFHLAELILKDRDATKDHHHR